MSFNEANTVEQMILDATRGTRPHSGPLPAGEGEVLRETPPGWGASLGGNLRPATWSYLPGLQVPRQPGDVMVESWLREALLRLNPEIAVQPDRADEVIYALRATILSEKGSNHSLVRFLSFLVSPLGAAWVRSNLMASNPRVQPGVGTLGSAQSNAC
ncbi:MAG: hypothetical protein ACYDH9_24740 [Limisphaerales bacterium]